jgi:hypothetical protein
MDQRARIVNEPDAIPAPWDEQIPRGVHRIMSLLKPLLR